jgi:hypothetical protein
MSRRPIVFWIACILSMAFIRCEESGPTDGSKDITLPAVKRLVGTYRLDHFQIAYDDGNFLSDASPNVTFSGTMTITTANQITQDVTLNGVSVHMTADVVSAPDDSTLRVNSQKKSYTIRIRFSAPTLITVLDGHQIGGTFVEMDTWTRTSVVVGKRADHRNPPEKTLESPGGGMGSLIP